MLTEYLTQQAEKSQNVLEISWIFFFLEQQIQIATNFYFLVTDARLKNGGM